MAANELPPGSAKLHLTPGVEFLHERETVFAGMIAGWGAQMRGGRGLRKAFVARSQSQVCAFQEFVDEWPWNWSSRMFDEWASELEARGLALSTRRNYQYSIRGFCEYLLSPHYAWVEECEDRFGTHPVQIVHEENSIRHTPGVDGDPRRRGLSSDELQLLFDRADREVDIRLTEKRKGATLAYRDATLFKVIFAWGLRANEACHLEITDLFRSPRQPQFGNIGVVQVRMGKGSQGSGPKSRTVATLYEWAVEALQDYLSEVRPLLAKPGISGNTIFLTERGTRMKPRDIADRFAFYRDELSLDPSLTPHSLRHSYATGLALQKVDAKFIQEQLGHTYASTTAIYTHLASDFMNSMMRDAIRKVTGEPEHG